jgi:Virulence factor membrane-bound polymerase, C-terminal/Protein glycosylation ligase/O-Antigen ligase
MSNVWLTILAVALAFSWLLPNHSQPWLSFHSDAWLAFVLSLSAVFVLSKNRFAVKWHWTTMTALMMAMLPLLQFVLGLILIWGIAWINFAYLMGFLVAILVGAAWENENPGQSMDFLFLAIGIAALVSVGLQLHQFLNLDGIGPWVLSSTGSRHFGNMGQPNQLATLLLLGLVGCGWAYYRKIIGSVVAIGLSALILFGVGLTESRTAWLNVLLLATAAVFWRRFAPSTNFVRVVVGLGCFFAIAVLLLPVINDWVGGGLPIEYRSAKNDPRFTAWVMFLKAAFERPWFGFGWGQLAHAQFLMMDEKIILGGSYLQAHNAILDLILWNGLVIGIALSSFYGWWAWTTIKRVASFSQVCLVSFLIVLGTHAMLEYPLQYAYFLMPAGIVMGSIDASMGRRPAFEVKKWLTALVLAISIGSLAITVRDYFRVETSFYGLRFELKKIDSPIPRAPPDVLALTQWRDYIKFARIEVRPGFSENEIVWMRNLVTTVPSAFVMYRFAWVLSLNDGAGEAHMWLTRLCLSSPIEHCRAIKREWTTQSEKDPRVAKVPFPVNPAW